jgi:hypothetical protein
VSIVVGDLQAQECLYSDPDGFIIKIFLASSRVTTKAFRLTGDLTPIGQTLKITNIFPKELEFWLCTQHNKIIVMLMLYRPTPPFHFPVIKESPIQFQFN